MGKRKRKMTSKKVTEVTSQSVGDDPVVPVDAVAEVIKKPCTLRSGRILTPTVPPVDPKLVKRLFNNPVVLKEIFRNLLNEGGDGKLSLSPNSLTFIETLKNCRLVCRSWNDLARPALLRLTIYDVLYDDHRRTEQHKDKGNLGLAYQLAYPNVLIGIHPNKHFEEEPTGGCCSFGIFPGSDVTSFPKPDDLTNIINYCTEHVEYLYLACVLHEEDAIPSFKSFPTLNLPRLKGLVLNDAIRSYDEDILDSQAGFFAELIKRAPNLEEFSLSQDYNGEELFRALYPALKSNLNFTSNLQVLKIDFDDMKNRHIKMLRRMNLRLKSLVIKLIVLQRDPFPAMVDWINDLKETLTNLELSAHLDLNGQSSDNLILFQLNFPFKMPVLRRLEIDDARVFGVKQIPDFLSQLPVLEVLYLFRSAIPLDKEQVVLYKTQPPEVFPRITDFALHTDECKQSDFSGLIVSKLFPNLIKLSISVYSAKGLYMLSDELKDSKIKDLCLVIYGAALKRGKDAALPCFSQWKGLHKISVRDCQSEEEEEEMERYGFPFGGQIRTHPLNPTLYSILSKVKNLTCLELRGCGKLELSSITKLVVELPLLRDLILGDWKSNFIYEDRVRLTEREVVDKFQAALVKKGLPTNPYLCVVNKNDLKVRY